MKKTTKFTIASTVSLFVEDRKSQGFKRKTIEFYTDRLKVFARWCEGVGVTSPEELTPPLIRRYFASMIEAGYAQATQNTSGRAIRTFVRWLVAEGLQDSNPLQNVKIPQPSKKVLPALTAQDVQRMLTCAPDMRSRAMILFLVDSGLRVSELCALNGGDVDLTTGQVLVRAGKGGKTRTCYVGGETTKAIWRYLRAEGCPEDGEPLWRSLSTGERLGAAGVRLSLKAIARDAGVKGASPHAFRRTHAIWSLRQGQDLHTLARQMGHADIHILKRYLDLSDADVATAHSKANVVGALLSK